MSLSSAVLSLVPVAARSTVGFPLSAACSFAHGAEEEGGTVACMGVPTLQNRKVNRECVVEVVSNLDRANMQRNTTIAFVAN